MADILATWLNEEVGLSKKVTDFEEDFASGYLLGELLYKFNQQDNFEQFSRKDAISHKLQNFERLEPTLRNLKIKFDSKMVDKIMKAERGHSLRLLYQLKMVLEKVYPPTDIAVLTKTGKFGDNQPAQKIPMPKEKYDNMQHSFFKQRLQALNKPQKVLNMESHVEKFNQEKLRQERNAQSLNDQDRQADALRKQEMRRIQINKLQRNAGFMEEWLQKGVDDWKKNQEIKKTRENAQLEFDYKQAEKYNNIAVQKLEEASKEVHEGIDNFEKTLRSQGINPKVDKQQAEKIVTQTLKDGMSVSPTKSFNASKLGGSLGRTGAKTQQSLQTKTGAFTLASTGLQQRTKKTATDNHRTAREKRRRRLIAQQATVMQELEQQHRESLVVELMKRQSNQEKELDYETWRTTQCKNIITENRKLRENQYEKRRELDTQTGVFKEEKMLESMKEQSRKQVDEMNSRTFEMRGYETQQKHKNRTELCSSLMDAIFDIADEAYNHQQDLDSDKTDPRNWHEWTQLFKHNLPIAGTLENLTGSVNEETGELNQDKQDASNAKLDELELIDFLQNKGQWPVSLITNNKPNLETIVNPAPDAAPTGKGKAVKQAQADQVQWEEGDLELTEKCENNFLMGDLIEQIIKINYEARAKLKHPMTPSWLSLKICLVGYPFAGKKVQAQLIKERFGLDTFQMDELVNEAIAFSEANPEPIPAKEKSEGATLEQGTESSEEDGLSEDEIQELNLPEDMRQIGATIQELLLSGEEITDELYVRLFVTKLRMTYEYVDPKTKRSKVRKQARRNIEIDSRLLEIEAELATEGLKKKQIRALEAEQETLKQEQEDIKGVKQNGWVLIDFPCNYAQAKLLEEALSGYQPEEEQSPIRRDQEIQDAYLLVQPNAKEQPPKMLLPSGLDAVLWFDCPIKEALRRADGRRYDTGADDSQIYHVDDVVPPVDQAPLCERLEQYSQSENSVASLVDRCISFDQATNSMRRWFKLFGDEDKGRELMQVIDCSKDQEGVFGQIRSVIQEILDNKNHRLNVIKEIISCKLKMKFEAEMKEQQEAAEKEALEKEEAEKVEETPEKPDKPASKSKSPEKSTQQLLATNSSQLTSATPPPVALPDRDNIDNDFKPVIIKLWQQLNQNYRSQMRKIFRNIRLNREQAFQRRAETQKTFLDYLHRLDNKQEILNDFVAEFNSFSDQYPDLREDDQTKEELHQRTDVLSDELWEIVEERKEQAIEERKKIMESGQVEYILSFFTTCAQQLMQAQLDKFKVSIQIIHDYYHAIEDKLVPEVSGPTTTELTFEGDDAPAIESLEEGADATKIESYNYPRLDKLLAMALKQQVVPDVTQVQVVADPKSKGKKDPKKAQKDALEEEKSVEESIYVKEMKEAIKVEKSILRFRLAQIRNWALMKLRDTRRQAIEMWKKLEDWIFIAQKTEMDAIEEMCLVIKDAIEEESKIQDELRIDFMDFTVDEKTLNYINPPPPLLEALEQYREDRFAIPQLKFLLTEFQQLEEQKGQMIKIEDLAAFLVNKINNSRNFQGYDSALPATWNNLGLIHIQRMLRNLDPTNSGVINWRQAFTYMILLTSSIPNKKDIEAVRYGIPAKERLVEKDTFTNASFWFDDNESQVDREYSHPFERVKMIKEILFDTFASNDKANIDELSNILEVTSDAENIQTFSDFLFADVALLQE